MAYIGRPLQVANLAVQSGTGDGSDTTPITTLDYATTTNGIAVYLDGVRQLAGTDFNVTAQTTLTFTTAPANGVGVDVYFLGLELSLPTPADASVTTAKIADVNVTTGKIADDAITLAKMAAGTDGNIISYDASGNPVAIATGSNGQVLTSTGAGSPPAFETLDAGGFPIGASAYVTGGQAISNNSATTLIFNTEVYDPNSDYNVSNGTYTVPSGQAGKYLTTGHISLPVTDTNLLGLGIKVNGTAKIFQGDYSGATDTGGTAISLILDLSVSDAVTWYCHHKAGTSKTTEVSAYGTGMSIQRIV